MKKGIYLFIALLVGCDAQERKENNVVLAPDADIEASGLNAIQAPDTSIWLTLLDRSTATSYTHGARACATLIIPFQNEYDQEMVVTNLDNDEDKFMSYRYILPANILSDIKRKLEIFQLSGFLEVDNTVDEDQDSLTYRLTTKGWGESPVKESFSRTLCYETGKWEISKILDYKLLRDQGSGLEAYQVSYETEYKLKDWVNSEVLQVFKEGRKLPKQLQTTLIKGPNGYFNAVNSQGKYKNTMMPSVQEATRIASTSEGFITRLCKTKDASQQSSEMQCTKKERLSITKSLIVHNVEALEIGRDIVFKVSFTPLSGTEQYIESNWRLNNKSLWMIN